MSLKNYLNEVNNIKNLSEEERLLVFKSLKSKDLNIREQAISTLVKSYYKMVPKIALTYSFTNISTLELIMMGNIGLYNAASNFDYKVSTNFHSYASMYIRGEISRGAYEYINDIKIPENIMLKQRRLKEGELYLTNELKRTPTDNDLSEYLSYSKELILTLKTLPYISELESEYHNTFNFDLFVSKIKSPSDEFLDNINNSITLEAISMLNVSERDIIKLRYGYKDRVYTNKEIGEMLNISPQRVNQIEQEAKLKLLKTLRRRKVIIN